MAQSRTRLKQLSSTLERGSLPFCGCSLEPDVEALPRMEACVRGAAGGGHGSEDRLPRRLLHTGCPRCPRPAEHLRLPGMSALIPCASPSMPGAEEQTPEVAHITGSRSSSRGTTLGAGWKDQGPHCFSGPGALGTFSDPHMPDTCCRATGFTPETVWAALTKEGALVTPGQGPGPPLTAHSTAVNRLC